MATTAALRALDDAGKLPDNYVNPYYLEDLNAACSTRRCAVHEKRRPEVSEIQEILTRFWDQLSAQPSGPWWSCARA